ncbi:MAG: hypothetical protein K2G90_00705 [Muribaculaceae bacterium]|nr:hypothetical protein [Muribaculaceae bacterium]
MKLNDIVRIAKESGWHTIITTSVNGVSYVDFQWKTKSGQPFTFSAEWDPENVESFIMDIEETEQGFNRMNYLKESLESLAVISLSTYFELTREIEDIHTRIWLLWVNIKYLQEQKTIWNQFPPYLWN